MNQIRTFDVRLTVGKHKNQDDKKVPTHMVYPFGCFYIDNGYAETIKLYNDNWIVIDMRIDGLGEGWSSLTIDGGVPLYKFPTPQFVCYKYEEYVFVNSGIKFMLEIRLSQKHDVKKTASYGHDTNGAPHTAKTMIGSKG